MTLFGDLVTGQPVPFKRLRQMLAGSGGLQEGVVNAGDFKVTQRGAGANMSVDVAAGFAWVKVDTGTNNGLSHSISDAIANVTVGASNATNPRVDQVVLRYNDSAIPTGAGNAPTLEVVPGTATAGATLDNRTGAAALPSDCMRIADVLVPAASTTVTTGNIRDRRPWARGAQRRIVRTSPPGGLGTSMALVDATNLYPRLECSGGIVTMSFLGRLGAGATQAHYKLAAWVDGTGEPGGTTESPIRHLAPANVETILMGAIDVEPAAGSRRIGPAMNADSTPAINFVNAATVGPVLTIREHVRQNTSND